MIGEIELSKYQSYGLYKDSLVVFIDILGFTKKVKNISNQQKFFETWNLLYAFKKEAENFNKDKETFLNFKFLAISDSLIITVPFSDKICAYGLIQILRQLQNNLLVTPFKTLVRGYVSRGFVFNENEIIFGEAYSETVKKEKEIGDAPKIVISPTIIEDARKVIKKVRNKDKNLNNFKTIFDLIKLDSKDNSYFIDYLKPYGSEIENKISLKQQKSEFNSIINFININLDKYKNEKSIYKKYLWLQKYYERCITYYKNF